MKIFEFLQEDNGSFSSTRLLTFLIVISAIIEWQHAIWVIGGIWHPDWTTVSLVAGVLGFKVLQKKSEQPNEQVSEPTNNVEENTKG